MEQDLLSFHIVATSPSFKQRKVATQEDQWSHMSGFSKESESKLPAWTAFKNRKPDRIGAQQQTLAEKVAYLGTIPHPPTTIEDDEPSRDNPPTLDIIDQALRVVSPMQTSSSTAESMSTSGGSSEESSASQDQIIKKRRKEEDSQQTPATTGKETAVAATRTTNFHIIKSSHSWSDRGDLMEKTKTAKNLRRSSRKENVNESLTRFLTDTTTTTTGPVARRNSFDASFSGLDDDPFGLEETAKKSRSFDDSEFFPADDGIFAAHNMQDATTRNHATLRASAGERNLPTKTADSINDSSQNLLLGKPHRPRSRRSLPVRRTSDASVGNGGPVEVAALKRSQPSHSRSSHRRRSNRQSDTSALESSLGGSLRDFSRASDFDEFTVIAGSPSLLSQSLHRRRSNRQSAKSTMENSLGHSLGHFSHSCDFEKSTATIASPPSSQSPSLHPRRSDRQNASTSTMESSLGDFSQASDFDEPAVIANTTQDVDTQPATTRRISSGGRRSSFPRKSREVSESTTGCDIVTNTGSELGGSLHCKKSPGRPGSSKSLSRRGTRRSSNRRNGDTHGTSDTTKTTTSPVLDAASTYSSQQHRKNNTPQPLAAWQLREQAKNQGLRKATVEEKEKEPSAFLSVTSQSDSDRSFKVEDANSAFENSRSNSLRSLASRRENSERSLVTDTATTPSSRRQLHGSDSSSHIPPAFRSSAKSFPNSFTKSPSVAKASRYNRADPQRRSSVIGTMGISTQQAITESKSKVTTTIKSPSRTQKQRMQSLQTPTTSTETPKSAGRLTMTPKLQSVPPPPLMFPTPETTVRKSSGFSASFCEVKANGFFTPHQQSKKTVAGVLNTPAQEYEGDATPPPRSKSLTLANKMNTPRRHRPQSKTTVAGVFNTPAQEYEGNVTPPPRSKSLTLAKKMITPRRHRPPMSSPRLSQRKTAPPFS
jgi:hypothetical protein